MIMHLRLKAFYLQARGNIPGYKKSSMTCALLGQMIYTQGIRLYRMYINASVI